MPDFTWTRDPNGGGFTGRAPGWLAYVLNDGTWTLFRSGELKFFAEGRAPSVFSARAAAKRAAQP